MSLEVGIEDGFFVTTMEGSVCQSIPISGLGVVDTDGRHLVFSHASGICQRIELGNAQEARHTAALLHRARCRRAGPWQVGEGKSRIDIRLGAVRYFGEGGELIEAALLDEIARVSMLQTNKARSLWTITILMKQDRSFGMGVPSFELAQEITAAILAVRNYHLPPSTSQENTDV